MMLMSSISDVDWCCCYWVENHCRFRSPNGPGLALGPQKSMVFGLIVYGATCTEWLAAFQPRAAISSGGAHRLSLLMAIKALTTSVAISSNFPPSALHVFCICSITTLPLLPQIRQDGRL
jgi:hypothetical protein